VEKWMAQVGKTCTQTQYNNSISAKDAFDLVIKENKRMLLVKSGNSRAVAQNSWNPDAARLMRLLAAGDGADGGGARGSGKGEEGREERERTEDKRRAEVDRQDNKRRDELDRRERADDKRREDASNTARREEDRRRKEAEDRISDPHKKQTGNGRGEERTGTFLPGNLREEAARNKWWENVDLESKKIEVKVARKCWVCADKVGPPGLRAGECPNH